VCGWWGNPHPSMYLY